MRRHARGKGACNGLTDKEVALLVDKKYAAFCNYRYELSSHMPDYRLNIYDRRVFNGMYFDHT